MSQPGPVLSGHLEDGLSDEMETDTDELAEQLQSTQLEESEDDEGMGSVDGNHDIEGLEEELETLSGDEAERASIHERSQAETPILPENIHEVAYSRVHQRYFDELGIQWGVQWELARLVTVYKNFAWEHVPVGMLQDLCGTNLSRAPIVGDLFLKNKPAFDEYLRKEHLLRQPVLISPWSEYDAEEAHIRDGNRATSIEDFGGKVQQRLHLSISKTGNGLAFNFTLEQPIKSKSNRFSRFLGSRRLIECHFSKKDARDHKKPIIDFFVHKRLLLNGRLFQAFYGHDRKVQLMEINEDFGRQPQALLGDNNRISLVAMIEWHNNIHLNLNQTLNKWVSRFHLGLSTSQPGLVFQPRNMHLIDDIYAAGKDHQSAATHQIMTDGCGFLNYAALKAIQTNMTWEAFPTCIQARIAGAKGLFMLDPNHRDPTEEPQIWMRTSQVKVKLNKDKTKWSPAHYILDVLKGSFVQTATSITYEMIMSLSENGVPAELLVTLLRDSIRKDAQSLEPSSKPHGSHILWDSVYSSHNVLQSRLRQVISPEAQRAQGFVEFDDDEDMEPEVLASAKWEFEPDPISGTPASAQEQVLGWLQAGFLPTDPFVMEKLVYLQNNLMETAVRRYRIEVPKSLRALIVPDPLDVLDAGEIFFASSQPIQANGSGLTMHCITGPVIVSRNPCIQISDTRKVVAVDNHELWSRGYYDVIVFSTKGDRSLASLLSGGDYDGDTVVMIWDEDITDSFTNAHTKYADPNPDFEQKNFDKSKHMLRDLEARTTLEKSDIVPHLLEALLQNISPNQLGIYNMFYRNSIYVYGLDNPITARLGHMFTQCLDAVKSGLTPKDDVFKRDRTAWDRAPPACFPSKTDDDGSRGQKPLLKPRQLNSPFILDVLAQVAVEETKAYKAKLGRLRDQQAKSYVPDPDLVRPFKEAEERVRRHVEFASELQAIKTHVKAYRAHYNNAQGNRGEFSAHARYGTRSGAKLTIGERQESVRAISEAYARNLPTGLVLFDEAAVRRVAASYAYQEDHPRKIYKFCFAVAWSELCAIKARAAGGSFVTSAPGFIEAMAVHKKIGKVFREMEGDSEDEEY